MCGGGGGGQRGAFAICLDANLEIIDLNKAFFLYRYFKETTYLNCIVNTLSHISQVFLYAQCCQSGIGRMMPTLFNHIADLSHHLNMKIFKKKVVINTSQP